VDDETGADWNGDDEIQLSIGVDADPVALFSGSWDSADSDEEWGGLAETIRNTVLSRTGQGDNLAFANSLGLEYLEEDDVAQGSNVAFVQGLAPSDDDVEVRRITLPVPDTISDGQYTFFCTLARFKN